MQTQIDFLKIIKYPKQESIR